MKTIHQLALLLFLFSISYISHAQNNEDPWLPNGLMQPSELAEKMEQKIPNLYIFNIGPAGSIKDAIEIGDGRDEESQLKFEKEINKLPKGAEIVIYCGCCPFKNCPNIRPIFKILDDNKFVNHKLLNLSENLKVDWIDKGFPMK